MKSLDGGESKMPQGSWNEIDMAKGLSGASVLQIEQDKQMFYTVVQELRDMVHSVVKRVNTLDESLKLQINKQISSQKTLNCQLQSLEDKFGQFCK